MAKRKIIWSQYAQIKLYDILDFYIQRNTNRTYSTKLYKTLHKEIKILLHQPNLGLRTEFNDIRCLIIANFAVYYESVSEGIIIHTLWDCRQNPDAK